MSRVIAAAILVLLGAYISDAADELLVFSIGFVWHVFLRRKGAKESVNIVSIIQLVPTRDTKKEIGAPVEEHL